MRCSLVYAIALSGLLAGCGTYVPEIQENPNASEIERANFIQAINRHVRCEVQDSVLRLYADNDQVDPQNRNLWWFDTWAVQISLTLTTDEKGSLNPAASFFSPNVAAAVFSLGVGSNLSSEAQRTNKIGSFFTIAELKRHEACPINAQDNGPFIQSDLKIHEWLAGNMISIDNGDAPLSGINGPNKSNVLSQEIKFDIISSGNITPGWKLIHATVNQGGNLFTASRDRTQDLTVTFGPPDPQWLVPVVDPNTHKVKIDPKTRKPMMRPSELSPAASSAALSAEIGNAVTNGLRSGLRP